MEIMKKTHHHGFQGVGARFILRQYIPYYGGMKGVLRNGFSSGSEKLISRPGGLFQHTHFKKKVDQRFHGLH
jgi:hypothetical protein